MHPALSTAPTLSRPARGGRTCRHAAALLALLGMIGAPQSRAEMTSGPVSQEGGPLSESSTNTRHGSGPVHDGARTLSDDRNTSLSGAPVRGSISGPLRSGAVSDATVGSVRGAGGTLRGRTVEEGSAGTVKKDIDAPLHEFSAEPLNDFGLLQHELRRVRPLAQDPAADAHLPGALGSPDSDELSGTAQPPDPHDESDADAGEAADGP